MADGHQNLPPSTHGLVSRKAVLLLFIGTYVVSNILWGISGVADAVSHGYATAHQEGIRMVISSLFLLIIQPLGLSLFLLKGAWSFPLCWIGYLAYLALILAALRYREKWQTILLWLVLAVLLALNFAGCYRAAADYGQFGGM